MKRQIYKGPGFDFKDLLLHLALAAAIVGGVLFCVCHSSCQLTSQGIQALGAEESPKILGVSVLSAKTVKIDFSKKVSAESGLVSELGQGQKASLDMIMDKPIKAQVLECGDGKSLLYVFEKEAELGKRWQLFSEIKDDKGNTLTFALPFDGFNPRVPLCLMIEVQANNGSSSTPPESPYVIIQALEDGNLFGVDLYSAQNKCAFSLPNVEVKAGEKIALHLKTASDKSLCVDELENDLALAKTRRSSENWRDLFFDTGKCIGGTNDAIFLRNRNSGKIMDALSYYTIKSGKTSWNLSQELQKAVDQNAWNGPASVQGSVEKTSSATKPLVRKKIQSPQEIIISGKNDWKLSEASVY